MIRVWVAMGMCLVPWPAVACRLALLLALDVSSSVDDREYALQRNGLAAALASPEVVEAFLGASEPVAVAAFEWSGRFNQQVVLPWTMIRSAEDLRVAGHALAGAERSTRGFQTALGHALGFAARYFGEAPACSAQTIDVSGDGESNHGFTPSAAYGMFPLRNVTVNALAIGRSVGLDNLVVYYRRAVIRGPGSFVEQAVDYADFERAMRRKLRREVASFAVGLR